MKELSDQSFESEIENGMTVVDYWAAWCGPCRMLAPILDEVANELDSIKFAKVNVDEEESVASKAGVRGLPTLVLYKDGKEVDRIVGLMQKDQLSQRIKSTFEI